MRRARRAAAVAIVAAAFVGVAAPAARAIVYTVAASGGDFTTIQAALDAAVAGDTIQVHEKATPYFEKIAFPRSGDAGAGFITLTAYPGETPVLDGTGVAGANMVLIDSRSWVKLDGFEIRNDLGVHDGSGVRVLGSGSHIEIRDNRIHDIRDRNAMGITVYATEAAPISELVIDGNEIYDCEPAPSEALTLNGNVTSFAVTGNFVHDVNNIGIDFIGGETDIQPDPAKVARDGVCRGNRVERARSSYGGGFAGGIYVDGGKDIVVENNVVTESDLGMEIGAENAGIVTQGIVVRDNVLYGNDKAGLVFGGFAQNVGRVRDSSFLNNTVYGNDTLGAGFGELWIQYAEANAIRNNVFDAAVQPRLLTSDAGNVDNVLDYNLWFAAAGVGGAEFVWNGTLHTGFAAYRAATGEDAHSAFADPLFANAAAADFHLAPGSPAIDAGDPAFVAAPGEVDLDGAPRVNGPAVDAGADETTICGNGVQEPTEACDDGNLVDGDGCDSNCTPTGCGNGVVTAGEACDDGNVAGGDCCDATCAYEAAGASCDDGDPCSTGDACDGGGACGGDPAPRSGCRGALAASLQLKRGKTPARNRLLWKWKKGAATAMGELGDPTATGYRLCVYDASGGSSAIALRAALPAGGLCRGKPCWSATGSGVKYRDRDATPDGITALTFKAGVAGKASFTLKGKGALVALPSLPLTQDPAVTAQLSNDAGVCWESAFSAPAAKNDATQFKDVVK